MSKVTPLFPMLYALCTLEDVPLYSYEGNYAPMLMVIDVGNTNLVFGLFEDTLLKAKFRMSTDTARTADEIGLHIVQFCNHFSLSLYDVDDVVISSVVPPLMYTLLHAIEKYMGKHPWLVGETLPTGLASLAQEPLGHDRAVTLIGALHRYGAPLILVDFGTATKVDALDEHGAYLGGVICPGIKISMDALFAKAAKLPRVEIKKPRSVIGVNTVEQMQAGAVYGFVGSVEGIVSNMKREMGHPRIPVVATGGLSTLISAHTALIDHTNNNLTMEGLQLLYARRPQ